MGETTQKLLDYLPNLYNKTPGTPGPLVSIQGAGSPVQIQNNASNIYQLMDAAGFSIDILIQDAANAKQESYVGVVPTAIALNQNPTNQFPIVLSIGQAYNTVDINYIFSLSTIFVNATFTLPSPTSSANEKYVIVTNSGQQPFFMYGFLIEIAQSAIFNWTAPVTLGNITIPGTWKLAASQYLSYTPTSYSPTSPNNLYVTLDPPGLLNPTDLLSSYTAVTNLSQIYAFFLNNILVPPNYTILMQWNGSQWNQVLSNYTFPMAPIGADSAYGNYYIGGSSWLDNVGLSYGVPRYQNELDTSYKNRITSFIAKPKMTTVAIASQLLKIFGLFPTIFEWYSSSYAPAVAALSSYNAYIYNPTGVSPLPYNLSAEPNYPNYGPAFNFYVIVPQKILNVSNLGVFSDVSFFDLTSNFPTLPPGSFPEFYQANPSDSNANNFGQLGLIQFILYVLGQIKPAGTVPIVIVEAS